MRKQMVNKKKKNLKKSNWKRQGKRCLALCGAAVLALYGTLVFTVPVGAATSDQATYNYPKSVKDSETGITWHDISKGSSTDRTKDTEKIIKTMLGYKTSSSSDSLLHQWGKVAYDVIGSDSRNWSTSNYEYDFGPEHQWAVDMAGAFDYDVDALQKGDNKYFQGDHLIKIGDAASGKKTGNSTRNKNCVWVSGLQIGTSLKDVSNALYDGISNKTAPKGTKTSDLQLYSDVPLLNDTTEQPVAYSLVCANRNVSSVYQFEYHGYALVFYDFELVPITEEAGIIFSDQMIANGKDDSVNISVPGFTYSSQTKNLAENGSTTAATLNNPGKEKATLSQSLTDTHGVTYNNSLTETNTVTKGKSFQVSKSKTKKLTDSFYDSMTKTTTVGRNFSEAYAKAESRGESTSETVTTNTNVSSEVPPHSAKSITGQQKEENCVVDYNQEVAIYYKTAVVAITGRYYHDYVTGTQDGKSYTHYQFCTVFGAVKPDMSADESRQDDDAITCLKNRYDKRNDNSKQGLETQSYTSLTSRKAQKVGKSDATVLSSKLAWDKVPSVYSMSSLTSSLDTDFHMMNAAGATVKESIVSTIYTVGEAVPTAKLSSLKVWDSYGTTKATSVGRITVGKGKNIVLANYQIKGMFSDGSECSSYKPSSSEVEWILMDGSGETIKAVNGVAECDEAKLFKNEDGEWKLYTKNPGSVSLKCQAKTFQYLSDGEMVEQIKDGEKVKSGEILVDIDNTSNGPSAASASMFSDATTGGVAVVVVVVLVIAGGIFVIVKKKRMA